jgi:hypothetical protein
VQHRRVIRLATFALAAGLLAGCGPSQPGASSGSSSTTRPADSPPDTTRSDTAAVTILLDRGAYGRGATVEMRITNNTSGQLGFNPCTYLLERQESAGWVAAPDSGRVCTMELWLLEGGATRTATTTLPLTATPAVYRLVLPMTREDAGGVPGTSRSIRAVSNPFRIE